MPNNIQSIEDLISSSQGDEPEQDSIEGVFAKKSRQIKVNAMERSAEAQASAQGFPYISLFAFPISPEALSLIDEKQANDLNLVCFFYDGPNMRFASTNPRDVRIETLLKELEHKLHANSSIYLVSEYSMKSALNLYKTLPKIRKYVSGIEISPDAFDKFKKEIKDYKSLNKKVNDVNISDVVTLILATAVKTGASDVHIEAEENGIVIRLRIDGVLQEAATIEKDKWKKIISRMKLLARVKINITERPQDGRFTIFLNDDKIDIRASFLPTSYGESVVMRLLKSSSVGLPFEELGLTPEAFKVLNREIKKPNGLILTTGPTGSGKTTTLYAILNKLNSPKTKIITLEDPVEYKLEGINQSQVDESKKYTFSQGLRSILRQDPDIVMVGEMRDLETSEIAIQASLTGHLVLSTLHTNDAAGVIPRLVELGVKPFLIVPSVNCIIGQRLVRKLCDSCKKKYKLSSDDEQKIKKILAIISPRSGVEIPSEIPDVYMAGKGCSKCNSLGFKGRVGIYEIFTMSNDIKELTVSGAPAFKILEGAIEEGMITMLQDGVLKVLQGKTSLEEIFRVIGKFEYVDALYDIVISKTIGRGLNISKAEEETGKELSVDLQDMEAKLHVLPSNELLNIVLSAAIKIDTSDVHIDQAEDDVRIRYRIDGILHDVAKITKEQYLTLLGNVKILSGFSTNVKKATYDGRFGIFLESDKSKIDCRVSIISGGYGETVVIRILSSQASSLDMENLGFRGQSLEAIRRCVKKTKGVIITTGPTGSGKTTTLYSLLNMINHPDVKIITIEDPIEYHLEGIMQTQINSDEGYTFASALRSLMRQNPNVIMVGEIRDNETAVTAVEASMTGHLVLSTIHSNSAAGAINRFVGLGVERQMLAGAIECSIGQRLVRKICEHCKEEYKPTKQELKEVKEELAKINPKSGVIIPEKLTFYKGKGCEKCSNIGYKGRIGIYEVLEMTPDVQKLIQEHNVTEYDIEQKAMEDGSLLMMQDGILKALAGETTIEEIFRVAR
ncbi:MAG: GspE/PulE family protein [Patescibacteria group bacterium]|jgi:type IV pilus assembly protein PilB|nr:GspE/PulE family protein [Patescibacteria group bacterium]